MQSITQRLSLIISKYQHYRSEYLLEKATKARLKSIRLKAIAEGKIRTKPKLSV